MIWAFSKLVLKKNVVIGPQMVSWPDLFVL